MIHMSKKGFTPSNKTQLLNAEEHGAIMAILALTLIPIFVMLVFAIDSLRMSSSHTQHENVANQMALGSLQALLDPEQQGESFETRLENAKARALEIGKFSGNSNIANSLAQGFIQQDNQNLATIETGQWFFAEPTGGCAQNPTNPCCANGRFQACYVATNDPNDANAIRINLRSSGDEEGKFMHVFGNITGMGDTNFDVSAIAAMVPRNGVFLVDLSRSTQYQTHLPVQRLPQSNYYRASEYAFRLANGVTCNSLPAPQGGANGGANYCANAVNRAIPSGSLSAQELALRNIIDSQCNTFYPGADATATARRDRCQTQECPPMAFMAEHSVYHKFMYPNRAMPNTPPADYPAAPGSDPSSATQHYQSDYQCFQISPPPNAAGTAQPAEYYMVDTQSDPEPLTTILSGISTSLDEINVRGVPGDRISVFAFDDTVFPAAATVTNQMRSFGPLRPGEAAVTELQNLLNGTSGRTAKINAFLFPGSRTNGSGASRGNTDLPNALLQSSATLMASPNFSSSYNFVALFSDGMVNCDHGEDLTIFFNGTTLGTPRCKDSELGTIGQSTNASGAFYLTKAQNAYYTHINGIRESTQIISRNSGNGGLPTSSTGAVDPLGCHVIPPNTINGACRSTLTANSFVDLGITFHYFPIGNDSMTFAPVMAAGGTCLTGKDLEYQTPYTGTLGSDSNTYAMVGASIETLIRPDGTCLNNSEGGNEALCNFLTNNGTVTPTASGYGLANSYLYAHGVHPTSGLYWPIMPTCAATGSPEINIDAACTAGSADAPVPADPMANVIETAGAGAMSMLVCDTKNRTADEQVRAGIEEIFRLNSFAVVQ